MRWSLGGVGGLGRVGRVEGGDGASCINSDAVSDKSHTAVGPQTAHRVPFVRAGLKKRGT